MWSSNCNENLQGKAHAFPHAKTCGRLHHSSHQNGTAKPTIIWTLKWALYEAHVGIQLMAWSPHLNLHIGTMRRIHSTFSSYAPHGENVLTPQKDKGDIKQINMIIRSGHSKLCKFSAVQFDVKSLYKLNLINSYLSRFR